MNWFLSRRKKEDRNEKDLNRLIFDVAEFHLGSDEEEVFRRLPNLELFAQIMSSNIELENGRKIILEEGMELSIPTVWMHDLLLFRFHVNKDDPRLGENFISMSVSEIFDSIEKTDSIGGFVFYNNAESYMAIPRQFFASLRKEYFS